MKSRISYRRRRTVAPRRQVPTAEAPLSYLLWSGQKNARTAPVTRRPKGGDA